MPIPVRLLAVLGSAAVLAAGAAVVCGGSACAPPAWDARGFEWIGARRAPVLDAFFAAITWLGSLWVLLPVVGAASLLLWRHGRGMDSLRFVAAFGGAVALAYLAKFLVDRPRPQAESLLIAVPADPAFPSGHAMQVTAFALAAVWAFAPPARRATWLAAALVLIVLVGLSRIYLQVHFPSDVLAGTAAAALWALGLTSLGGRRHA